MFEQLPMYQNMGGSAYKKDLKNITLLCDYLNNPQKNFRSVHVGGTNGKGSTSHMISSVLQEAGYKVGLYTSPHIKDFRERIKINGESISKDYVTNFINKNFDFFKKNKLSFFEMTVGLSFDYFSSHRVDLAIIEVGMGGRLDSTNIISPLLSIITNVSLDHTKFLGNTISQIAFEKAGIIKKNTPVLIGEFNNEINEIFNSNAKQINAPIYFANQIDKIDFNCDLKGKYQIKNIQTTLNALKILSNHFDFSNDNISNGLSRIVQNTGLIGRWHKIQNNPLTICDTAHNESALKEVVGQLLESNYKRLHFILGFSNDKDMESISKVFPQKSEYYFVESNVGRAMQKEYIKDMFQKSGKKGVVCNSVNEAFTIAKDKSENNDVIFIGGSTFVVAEIL